MYDVVIIGAGVTGCAVARELSRYKLKTKVLEKAEDLCCGTSKANSGIVHAGFDCKPGTLMAEMNVQGNQMMKELSKELDFSFKQNGSLVLCFSEDDRPALNRLYEQGIENGVKELKILEKKELKEMEPNVSDEAVAALFAPTGGIVCPFGLTIAFGENAAVNGVEFQFDSEVQDIKEKDGIYQVILKDETIETKCVVNAAGVYADAFHNMVSTNKISITPRKGEYFLLDKTAGDIVSHTIFQLPGKYGKGVLVSPTVHGNMLVGPTATDQTDKEGNNTTREGLDDITEKSKRSVQGLPMRQIITSFAGLRAHEEHHEFIIEEVKDAPGFFDCAGIESPGLTSAPAIGKKMAGLVAAKLQPEENKEFCGTRKGVLDPKKLSQEEYNKLIAEKPEYGNIICRCEMVTEGEIMDSIHRPLGAKSLDGVKRRTRAGMGRCQAGFCSPKTMEILARELKVSQFDITKAGGDSKILMGLNKEV